MKTLSPALLVSLIAIQGFSLHGEIVPSLRPPAPAIIPAWETRALAGNYELNIPAPRGQISDRNGTPLAQTRLGYNLGLKFTPPLTLKDPEIVAYARRQAAIAQTLIGSEVTFDEAALIKHYHNRGVLPFELSRNLPEAVNDKLKKQLPTGFVLLPNYFRIYPNGKLAAHVLGYAGRQGRIQTGPIDNGEKLWPEVEGRDGLEQAFNAQLTGQSGMTKLVFDKSGSKISENIAMPPNPGYNVVTSLDANIQKLAEDALEKGCKRGAMVILDPTNGDILAMASWPSYNPNDFIPTISPKDFDRYNKDPNIPLLPRAFRSSYPPGSTFKVITGLAALESGSITSKDYFDCPAALTVGNTVMRNWKKKDSGSLDFMQALTQSCNTWFYQVGIKTGAKTIIDYASRLGIGKKTGVPLGSETNGRLPNDEYMMKVYKRKMLNGDTANMAIGQGDLQISPLQMAQAMMGVGNGGIVYQPRLVLQIQTPDNKVVNAYGPRAKAQIEIRPDVQKVLKAAMINVVSGAAGTAHQAAVPGIEVAGKTGTAQWGPTHNQRTAAWFAGFAPAEHPKYAFAVVYEGAANNNDVHGGTKAAPLIGQVLRKLFADEKKASDAKDKQDKQDKKDKKDQAAEDAKNLPKDEVPDEE